jgi:thymidylate synthase
MLAQVTGLKRGEFVHTLGDAHLYLNHLQQAKTQIQRTPYALPQLHLNPERTQLEDFVYEDFTVQNYQAHPHIKAPIAV